MRLFIGIGIPHGVRFSPILARLSGSKGVRVPPTEQLHITLKFLGQVDENAIPSIRDALRRISHPSFVVRLAGIGGFPKLSRPRVLYVGVEENPFLADLARKVDKATERIPLDKPFRPHVTVARVSDDVNIDLPALEVPEFAFHAQEFALYSSKTLPTGSKYEIIERFALGRG